MLYPTFKNLLSSVRPSVRANIRVFRGYFRVQDLIRFIPLRIHWLVPNNTFLAHKTLWKNNIGVAPKTKMLKCLSVRQRFVFTLHILTNYLHTWYKS